VIGSDSISHHSLPIYVYGDCLSIINLLSPGYICFHIAYNILKEQACSEVHYLSEDIANSEIDMVIRYSDLCSPKRLKIQNVRKHTQK